MKRLATAVAIGSLLACSGGSSGPTAPTPPAAPANIAGPYEATVTASSTCSANLPSATRALQYSAEVLQTGTAVQVQLIAHGVVGTVTVSGTVSGQTVNFPSFSVSETVGRGAALVASGNANVTADGSITGTLSGTYQTPSGLSCNAANHQLQMVKLCQRQAGNIVELVPCV
jgi:hypothetical protein